MKKKLTALVTAGAIVTAGLSATPASANQSQDLLRFVVGVAVIGAIINSANSNRPRPSTQNYTPKPRVCLRQRWSRNGWLTYYDNQCMNNHGWDYYGNRWHRGW